MRWCWLLLLCEVTMFAQIDLLHSSFQAIEPLQSAFSASLYARLFMLNPELQPFFARSSLEEQQHKLLLLLTFFIDNLERPERLAAPLQRLGQLHAHHGVPAAHFDYVGCALLDTFAEYLGPAWTPQHHAAWLAAFNQLVALMLAGYPSQSTS